jgi:hypothetical protein
LEPLSKFIALVALDVFSITRPTFGLSESHVQPDPKLAAAWAVNSSRNLDTEPHFLMIASLEFPIGYELFGVMQVQ